MNRVKSSVVGLLLLSMVTAARADKVDDYIKQQMEKRHIPGVSVAVVKDGKVVLAKGYGVANAELSVPATENTVYQLASVTKQFTATAIMMLVEEGKLSLDTKLNSLLSGMPSVWDKVTVRHLLNHTSGIKSYTDVAGFDKTLRKDFTRDEIIKLVAEVPVDFQPGEKWKYNNTGFFLLGLIIEKVSGKTYEEYLKEKIFTPLQMTVTRLNNLQTVIPNRATGYSWNGKTLINGEYLSPTQPFAAGALLSTISDMAKWDMALTEGKLLKKESYKMMWEQTKLTSGGNANYGFGWALGEAKGHKIVEHGGGIPGFNTQIMRFPDDKTSIIVLTNQESAGAGGLAAGIASFFVPGLEIAEKPAEGKKPSKEDAAKVADLVKGLFKAAAEEKLDLSLFTPEAGAKVKEALPQVVEGLKQLGTLKSMELIENGKKDALNTYRFRAMFENATVICNLALTAEGKIAGINLMPE